ncbi:Protein weak chloroplast movement under blue light 1 [Apostasia shenzhenica]|uniref:Protein weak chloroplast movement under blue light 1 n=1 Tax=Apostasia shenzhenica TaxID=1088818 RepID=A0A2I0ANG5_9ASPA|nr:Protein weak chloroplast movement under blue light 1 [Apostasia shenzhenica]
MAGYKDSSNVLFLDQPSQSESVPAASQFPNPEVAVENKDTYKGLVKENGSIGQSMKALSSTSFQSSDELRDAPEGDAFLLVKEQYPASDITNENPEIILTQNEAQGIIQAGEVDISNSTSLSEQLNAIPLTLPKKVEIVPLSANVPDAQDNNAETCDDQITMACWHASAFASEEFHNTTVHYLGNASKDMQDGKFHQNQDGSSLGLTATQTDKIVSVDEDMPSGNFQHEHDHVNAKDMQLKTSDSNVSTERIYKVLENRGVVDTTTPFESVKEAVTKFGGIVDWKAHKAQTIEKRKRVRYELEKVQEEIPMYRKQSEDAEAVKTQVLKELNTTKRVVEELNLNLERAQNDEAQAKQDAELAQLRAKEVEEGIADEMSFAAKTQLEVAKSRHEAAVLELKSVRKELAALEQNYASFVGERDIALSSAEEAVSTCKEIEKTMEELTLEFITTKESLEAAHTAHLDAEEHRIGASLAKDQDCLNWDKEIKQAEEELMRLHEQLLQTKDLKSNLERETNLLLDLKKELAAYMESRLKEQSESIDEQDSEGNPSESKKFQLELASKEKELREVKLNIEKAKNDVSVLRVAESSLKSELHSEKTNLVSMRQREGMASIAVSSLETEIERMKEEIRLVLEKEKEARDKMVKLPKLLQQSALEADQSASSAKMAREELKKVNEEAEQAKATLSTTEIRFQATLKEIEAAKTSERLAIAAVKALQESEVAGTEDSPRGVTLPLDEYYNMSKRAHEAEELANETIAAALVQIQVAKDSEVKSLQRLEEAYIQMEQRKEALRAATARAEKAKEEKLGVEQELRKRRASSTGKNAANSPKSPAKSFEDNNEKRTSSKEAASVAAADVVFPTADSLHLTVNKVERVLPEIKLRKKKSFFPRIVMFFARRRSKSMKRQKSLF